MTTQVHRIYIHATPQPIWGAITKPEWSSRYGYDVPVEYDLNPGGIFRAHANAGMKSFQEIPDVVIDGEVLACNPAAPPRANMARAHDP
jgi:hypothetical protein